MVLNALWKLQNFFKCTWERMASKLSTTNESVGSQWARGQVNSRAKANKAGKINFSN